MCPVSGLVCLNCVLRVHPFVTQMYGQKEENRGSTDKLKHIWSPNL